MPEKNRLEVSALQPGFVLDSRYHIQSIISVGGMGVVYLATDHDLSHRLLAIKVLHKQFAQDSSYVERFKRELEIINKISHPNVVRTYSLGEYKGLVYFTMEYIAGESLDKMMRAKLFDEKIYIKIITGVSLGLAAIHEKKIIHRDIKPGNIILTDDGKVKIIDFGAAKPEFSELTAVNQRVGSIAYMSPEVWKGEELTPAVDFYSLGVMLYEMATGAVPFDDKSVEDVMEGHVKKGFRIPKDVNPKIKPWLNELIINLLQKEPAKRINSSKKVFEFLKEKNVISSKSEPGLHVSQVKQAVEPGDLKRRPTVLISLTATKNRDAEQKEKVKRRKTVVIDLPKKSALIFEFEMPSRDFIFLGIFLASLQVFDGVLTASGIDRFGLAAEGNYALRTLMHRFGPETALAIVKFFAILAVLILTVLAKRIRWIKDVIATLSCIYLFAAILPWLYLLYVRHVIF